MTDHVEIDGETVLTPEHGSGNGIAFAALVLPVLAGSVQFFVSSVPLAIAISAVMVLATAVLMAVDFSRLAATDAQGRTKESTLTLFLAMCALWVIGFPYAFFRRQRFCNPKLGMLSVFIALYAGFGPLAYALIVPPGLPSCTSPEVVALLQQNIPGAMSRLIDGHREISFDSVHSVRHGRCMLHTETGNQEFDYFVEWQDRENRRFQVRFLPTELPVCTNPQVIQLVEQVIRADNPGAQIEKIVGHREISFDREKNVRLGMCTVHLNGQVAEIHYTVEWVDRKIGSISVRTVPAPTI